MAIQYKQKIHKDWEELVTALISGGLDVSFYPKDGQVYISIGDEHTWSLVINKNGTWSLA